MRLKKLYYVPGLITAVLLPLLLVYFDERRPVEQTRLQLFVPSDIIYPDTIPRFTRQFIEKDLEGKT